MIKFPQLELQLLYIIIISMTDTGGVLGFDNAVYGLYWRENPQIKRLFKLGKYIYWHLASIYMYLSVIFNVEKSNTYRNPT